jgi:hypothetical protein
METKNPPAGSQGGRASVSLADTETLSQNPAFSQPTRREFCVIIARDLWRRCVVSVEPATITRQPRSFPDHGAAMAFAEGLSQLEGWPICDRVGGAE